MSNKFGEMSLEVFCDYVSANPGGARKAFELRKKAGGDCGGGKERVVEKKVEVPVEKVIYKERVVEKVIRGSRKEKVVRWVKYPCMTLMLLGVVAWTMGPPDNVVATVVKEVPVEVVKEVMVENPDTKKQLRIMEVRLANSERHNTMMMDMNRMDSNDLMMQIKLLERRIDRGNY